MSKRRPDRDKRLQRLLGLDEAGQIAALQAMFGEPQELEDDDDLDDLERAARVTLHGTKGRPPGSRNDDRLFQSWIEWMVHESQANRKAIDRMSKSQIKLYRILEAFVVAVNRLDSGRGVR